MLHVPSLLQIPVINEAFFFPPKSSFSPHFCLVFVWFWQWGSHSLCWKTWMQSSPKSLFLALFSPNCFPWWGGNIVILITNIFSIYHQSPLFFPHFWEGEIRGICFSNPWKSQIFQVKSSQQWRTSQKKKSILGCSFSNKTEREMLEQAPW